MTKTTWAQDEAMYFACVRPHHASTVLSGILAALIGAGTGALIAWLAQATLG